MIYDNFWLIKNARNVLISRGTATVTQSIQLERLKSFHSCFSRIWAFLDRTIQAQQEKTFMVFLNKTHDKSTVYSVDIVDQRIMQFH